MEEKEQEFELKRLKTIDRIRRANRSGVEYVAVSDDSVSSGELSKAEWFGTFPIMPGGEADAREAQILDLLPKWF